MFIGRELSGTLYILPKRQIRALELRQAGFTFGKMSKCGFSKSTAHDAYNRSQRNLDRIMATIDFLIDHDLLSAGQIERLRRILQKL